ncbi:MAG: polysaccharide deacetylase family protein [Flavobacteriia bacterium]|jgi:peptidoglycan/xylan/chitin deacetylase (PgdA/CDA1 family)
MISNFLFHRVSIEKDNLWEPMTPELFEKCIRFISKEYDIHTIEDIIQDKIQAKRKKLATLSFDDGYKDNIEYGAPILQKYNCRASFYVVTNCINLNKPTWTYIFDFIFQNAIMSSIDIDLDFLPSELRKSSFSGEKDRLHYASKLKPYLKKLKHEERNQILDFLSDRFSEVEIPRIMMNWEDLNQLKNAGHTIGSHSHTHPMLGSIKNEEISRYELKTSFDLIKQHIGQEPLTISYPIGSCDEIITRQSREIGYKMGLIVDQKVFEKDKMSIFEIPRIELYNESWFKTKLRITNRLERIKKMINYK